MGETPRIKDSRARGQETFQAQNLRDRERVDNQHLPDRDFATALSYLTEASILRMLRRGKNGPSEELRSAIRKVIEGLEILSGHGVGRANFTEEGVADRIQALKKIATIAAEFEKKPS